MKYFLHILLIGGCVAAFIFVINPRYVAIKDARAQISGYSTSLSTAEKLKSSREELIGRYNSISKADLDSIKTLLPDSVDNIRLIIQLDSLAAKNGMSTLRNVDYKTDTSTGPAATTAIATSANNKPYGEFTVTFQTTGQYKNFLSFLADLEQNLRLVDVVSVDFASTAFGTDAAKSNTAASSMSYKITLKTYWLKQ